ncbi:hypothetical protein CC53_gp099 [Rhizobium phage vB_RleS_L338C]|nr:hypothetical protein CC53_gp099 [Rhizobium phage vB_RleS_L338C]AHC30516.1 hypothetical protein L338C_99 [Rhizobium phage vB_RleS_L338C]QNH72198.1 hypothetical protein P11VFA_051 [Rhizobium phage P11VFA]
MAVVKYNAETNKHDVIIFGADTVSFDHEDEAEGFAEFVNGGDND